MTTTLTKQTGWIVAAEMDSLVARIRALVRKHGGQSQPLAALRDAYALLHACPEKGAFALVTAEVERLEREP